MNANIKRDENGLLKHVVYKTNEDGTINWRAMIKPEHLFPNKGWFEMRKREVPSSIEGLEDSQLLIKLAGIKDLAKLRGYKSVKYDIIKCDPQYVVIKCGITWIPNLENEYETHYEDVANATVNNTSDFAIKFLETIAANRAFVRAVRNYLNVYIVGSDEIDSSKKNGAAFVHDDASEMSLPTPQAMLEKTVVKLCGFQSFENFQHYLRYLWKENSYRNEAAIHWKCYTDIPIKEARILMAIIKDKYKQS